MSPKEILSRRDYWKSVALLGLGFMIVFNLISIWFEYGSFDFEAFYKDKIENKWFRFILAQLASSLIYGMIIAYGQIRSKLKRENQEN